MKEDPEFKNRVTWVIRVSQLKVNRKGHHHSID